MNVAGQKRQAARDKPIPIVCRSGPVPHLQRSMLRTESIARGDSMTMSSEGDADAHEDQTEAYVCPHPNYGRGFNVKSNMRRHYRHHFAFGHTDANTAHSSLIDDSSPSSNESASATATEPAMWYFHAQNASPLISPTSVFAPSLHGHHPAHPAHEFEPVIDAVHIHPRVLYAMSRVDIRRATSVLIALDSAPNFRSLDQQVYLRDDITQKKPRSTRGQDILSLVSLFVLILTGTKQRTNRGERFSSNVVWAEKGQVGSDGESVRIQLLKIKPIGLREGNGEDEPARRDLQVLTGSILRLVLNPHVALIFGAVVLKVLVPPSHLLPQAPYNAVCTRPSFGALLVPQWYGPSKTGSWSGDWRAGIFSILWTSIALSAMLLMRKTATRVGTKCGACGLAIIKGTHSTPSSKLSLLTAQIGVQST
ncbi:hypothetical protein B0H16DRAFT_1466822 [Mycena metata]|uniref:Uncharacterized protein n=1 Tax=Mycena metata TaxID=1033252 RepID=A0AAD7I6B7_9AGAR|nr:hypothetical protein B0H16DRAFT_1466822 [Mycena metata]